MSNTSKKDEIFITFTFQKNGEQIYIDANPGWTLHKTLNELSNKYPWLLQIMRLCLRLDGTKQFPKASGTRDYQVEDLNKTLRELGVKDGNDFIIYDTRDKEERYHVFDAARESWLKDLPGVQPKYRVMGRNRVLILHAPSSLPSNSNQLNNFPINPNFNNQFQLNNFQNQFFNNVHMLNNMQNNIQNQPFYKSVRLRTIFNYLTSNNFCLPGYNDRTQLIIFLNNLYNKGTYKYIPSDIEDQKAWNAFKYVKHNHRHYMEAVYRIFFLCPKNNQQAQLDFLQCANITMNDLLKYANSRNNIPNNQNMNQNNNMINQNKMNMNMMNQNMNNMNQNNMNMNNMNMNMQNMNNQNNFNLMNGFWQGGWFTWDKRPIEALINAAGLNINKYTLYNNICKKIHEIDWQLQQKATYTNEKKYIEYINKYNQALRFLSLYFADIIESCDPKHYSYYFKNYNSMYRFLPPYVDPMNKSPQYGKVTFYNTVANCYQEFPLTQLDNTNDLPEICNNVGATCYANACRNMILSNKMLRVVLSRIGGDLLGQHQIAYNIVEKAMNQPWGPTGSLCNKVKGVGGCTNPSPDPNKACACKLSVHAKKLVQYARDNNWGVLEMLCLYACCADLASQMNNNNRINFLSKIFTATMVIIGDENPLFRQAGAGDANTLSTNLNIILTNSLSQHIKREVPTSGMTEKEQMEGERLGRSLYGVYNVNREVADDRTIPGQLSVKSNVTESKCGHNKFNAENYPFTQLDTASYTSPQGGTIYDLQSALSLENSPTVFQGENGLYCNACNGSFDTRCCYRPVCGSLLSQLIPNYGKGNSGKNRVVFNEYVVNWSVPTTRPPEVYQLKCFIMHTGGHGAGGHYISYHKVHTGGTPPYQWYVLNDGSLSPIGNNTVQGILRNPSFGAGNVAMRLYYERVPSSQMMCDPYGALSVSPLTIPSHEDLKLSDPLYMSFFNKGNNNYGEPNPNNPYTAVHGLQQLLINLDLGRLVTQQAYNNVRNQYTTWNNNTQCAGYNNNLPVQPMNNMIMNNFIFPQQKFIQPFNNNVNVNMMKQGNGVAASF